MKSPLAKLATFAIFPTLCAFAPAAHATPTVLDDYSSAVHFDAGRYTFVDVINGYPSPRFPAGVDAIIVEDGSLTLPTLGTAAQVWTAGEKLTQVGDKVSIDVRANDNIWGPAGGLFIDSDPSDPADGVEIRFQRTFLKTTSFDGVYEQFSVPLTFLPGNNTAIGQLLNLEIQVIDIDAVGISLMSTLTSEVAEPAIDFVTIPGTEAYFGPLTYAGGRLGTQTNIYFRDVFLDNLTFESATTTGHRADLDADGDVDNDDLNLLLANFTASEGSTTMTLAQGDFDADGDIDNIDAGYLLGQYTPVPALTSPAGLAAVPEPSSLVLLAGAGLLGLTRRR